MITHDMSNLEKMKQIRDVDCDKIHIKILENHFFIRVKLVVTTMKSSSCYTQIAMSGIYILHVNARGHSGPPRLERVHHKGQQHFQQNGLQRLQLSSWFNNNQKCTLLERMRGIYSKNNLPSANLFSSSVLPMALAA